MRDYAKVAPTLWTGSTGKQIRALGRDCQVLAFYLLTNPHANMLGLYYLPLPFVAHETGIPLEGALKGLASLSEVGFCAYDEASEFIWVFEMARFQIGAPLKASDNRVAGIRKEYASLPKNPFLKGFFERYENDFHLNECRESTSPSEAPSKPLRSQEQEQEQEKEQEQERERGAKRAPASRQAAPRATLLPADFELTDERRAYAEAEGIDAERTFAKFTDYWRAASGAKARKRDWDATWRNWCRREAESAPQANGTGRAQRSDDRPLTRYERIAEIQRRAIEEAEE